MIAILSFYEYFYGLSNSRLWQKVISPVATKVWCVCPSGYNILLACLFVGLLLWIGAGQLDRPSGKLWSQGSLSLVLPVLHFVPPSPHTPLLGPDLSNFLSLVQNKRLWFFTSWVILYTIAPKNLTFILNLLSEPLCEMKDVFPIQGH